MILELDQGNTRLKWRALNGGAVFSSGALLNADLSLERLLQDWAGLDIGFARAACVASVEVKRLLIESVRSCFGLELQFAKVAKCCAGLRCAYDDVSRLGVDRWMVAVAAANVGKEPSLVVDCGSAITIDMVCSGEHLGGYIAPGYELMRRALFKDTASVKVGLGLRPALLPGRDTIEAVNSGLWASMLGLLLSSIEQLRDISGSASINVFVCGGDGESLMELLPASDNYKVLLRPDLVMDGLGYCLPFDEAEV